MDGLAEITGTSLIPKSGGRITVGGPIVTGAEVPHLTGEIGLPENRDTLVPGRETGVDALTHVHGPQHRNQAGTNGIRYVLLVIKGIGMEVGHQYINGEAITASKIRMWMGPNQTQTPLKTLSDLLQPLNRVVEDA